MQDYERAVQSLIKLPQQQPLKEQEQQSLHLAATDIIASLKSSHKSICENDPKGILTRRLITRLATSPLPQFSLLLREILEILFLKESPLLVSAVYPVYPILLRRFIEAQEVKDAGTTTPRQIWSNCYE